MFCPAASNGIKASKLITRLPLRRLTPVKCGNMDVKWRLLANENEGIVDHPIRKVIFLVDNSCNENVRFFYNKLNFLNTSVNFLHIVPMPDVHEFNTKRYEQMWMNYMRSLTLNAWDVVVGHGSSGDALLRFLESCEVNRAVIIDGADIYTAGGPFPINLLEYMYVTGSPPLATRRASWSVLQAQSHKGKLSEDHTDIDDSGSRRGC